MEKEVLWLSGSLAASGCILDRSGSSGCRCSCGPLYRASAAAHAAGALAHLHVIHKVTQIARCVLPRGGWGGGAGRPLFPMRALADTLRPRVRPPCGHFRMEMSALSWGGTELSYLLPGIWLKCAPFHSPRVPFCASACHYLQMRDFTLVGHVNRDCDANFMDSSKGKFAPPPLPPSLPSVPVAPFVPFRTYIHGKLLALIGSPPTTL